MICIVSQAARRKREREREGGREREKKRGRRRGEMSGSTSCPAPMKATSNGAWQGDDPLHFALPLIILQICLVVVLTRLLAFLLRPLRQPRVVAEIIVSFAPSMPCYLDRHSFAPAVEQVLFNFFFFF